MPLSTKQQRFIAEYLIDGNATQAAIRAGYSPGSAAVTACRMLTKDNIQSALEEGRAKLLAGLTADAGEVLSRLTAMMRGNIGDFVAADGVGAAKLDFSKVTREQWAIVQQVKVGKDGDVTLKLYDARAAAVDLGKHLGLFGSTNPFDAADAAIPERTPERDEARLLLLALELMRRGGQAGGKAPAPTKH